MYAQVSEGIAKNKVYQGFSGGMMLHTGYLFGHGICHPITIKLEYYFGRKGWWGFFIPGVICMVISLLLDKYIASTIVAAFAFSCFWGIGEVFKQEKRVLKGWFPENPKRHAYYERRRKELKMGN